jgi:hypothetical protein
MKYRTEATPQGEQHVLDGAERISEREMLERRMNGPAKATKAQKAFETTELFGGLPPHQDRLL